MSEHKLILSKIASPKRSTLLLLFGTAHDSLSEMHDESVISDRSFDVLRDTILSCIALVGLPKDGPESSVKMSREEIHDVQRLFNELITKWSSFMDLSDEDRGEGYYVSQDSLLVWAFRTSLKFQFDLYTEVNWNNSCLNVSTFCEQLIATWRLLPSLVSLINEAQPTVR